MRRHGPDSIQGFSNQLAAEARAAEAARHARIRSVAEQHPDMPLCLIAERFNTSEAATAAILHEAGIKRTRDYLADVHNGVRSRRTRGW